MSRPAARAIDSRSSGLRRAFVAGLCVWGCAAAVVASPRELQQAEQLAREALAEAEAAPERAIAKARRALALTEEFEPTDFVGMGRKGEVVEDEFLAARRAYREHRARLYEAMGEGLRHRGQLRPAVRFLGRAVLLDRDPQRVSRLAAALLAEGRARAAIDSLAPSLKAPRLPPALLQLLEQAVDLAGWASAQVEIDRARLAGLGQGVSNVRDGPIAPQSPARLSTGAPLVVGESPLLFYVAAASCRTCSADLETLKRVIRAPHARSGRAGAGAPEPASGAQDDARVVMLPEDPDQDHALRQVLGLYRYDWPVLVGRGQKAALGAETGSVLLVARSGFLAATLRPPFAERLPEALRIVAAHDVAEALPRSGWNRRPPDRTPEAAAPAVSKEGLAPGEDAAVPAAFTAGVDAFAAGRPLEALRFFDSLKLDDGWLLPPERRFNRARCLAALGRNEEARRILLRIGDSRFQAEVDKALESAGSRR